MKPVQFCMFVNPVLTNIKRFSYILVIVSNSHTYGTNQIFSNPTEYALQLHEPHVIGTSLYRAKPLYVAAQCFPNLHTSHGFTLQSLSSKTSATFTQHGVPSQHNHCFLSTSGFQPGRLSVERPQTAPKYAVLRLNESAQQLKSQVSYLQTLRNHVRKDCVSSTPIQQQMRSAVQ